MIITSAPPAPQGRLRRLPPMPPVRGRHPAVSTPRVMSAVSGGLLVGGGLLALAESLTDAGPGAAGGAGHSLALSVIALVSVAGGLVVLAARYRLARWTYHLVVAGGTVLVTASVSLAGSTVSAVVLAMLYTFIATGAFIFFSWPAALAHLGLVVLGALVGFTGTDLPVSDRVVVLGAVALVGLVIGWLVRMADVAETDGLTGLVNRRGFDRALAESVARATHDHEPLALALIDLDHFKAFNDSAGRAHGDRLLQATSAAWLGCLEPGQLLARYGGDGFALVLPGLTGEEAGLVVQRLRATLNGRTCSTGIATATTGDTGSLLTRRADAALYEAKRTGRDRVAHGDRPDQLGVDLRRALDRDELFLAYQPVLELSTGALVGVEALVRWRHPTRGVLGPDAFIPFAESDELIHDLGFRVAELAVGQARRWHDRRGFDPNIAINAAGPELSRPGYADRLLGLLADVGLPPDRLVLEVTETTLDADSSSVIDTLQLLRRHGVKVAIDDFGTGWSSLSRLDRLPADILKIDRSFVSPIDEPGARTTLLAAVVALGKALDLDIVAEGVETPGQHAAVRRLGCGFAQGYLYARPAEVFDDAVPVVGTRQSPSPRQSPSAVQSRSVGTTGDAASPSRVVPASAASAERATAVPELASTSNADGSSSAVDSSGTTTVFASVPVSARR